MPTQKAVGCRFERGAPNPEISFQKDASSTQADNAWNSQLSGIVEIQNVSHSVTGIVCYISAWYTLVNRGKR